MSYWRQKHHHIVHGLSRRRLTGFNRFPDKPTALRSLHEQKTDLLDRSLYDVVECEEICQPLVFDGAAWELSNTAPDWLILDDSADPLIVSKEDPEDIRPYESLVTATPPLGQYGGWADVSSTEDSETIASSDSPLATGVGEAVAAWMQSTEVEAPPATESSSSANDANSTDTSTPSSE